MTNLSPMKKSHCYGGGGGDNDENKEPNNLSKFQELLAKAENGPNKKGSKPPTKFQQLLAQREAADKEPKTKFQQLLAKAEAFGGSDVKKTKLRSSSLRHFNVKEHDNNVPSSINTNNNIYTKPTKKVTPPSRMSEPYIKPVMNRQFVEVDNKPPSYPVPAAAAAPAQPKMSPPVRPMEKTDKPWRQLKPVNSWRSTESGSEKSNIRSNTTATLNAKHTTFEQLLAHAEGNYPVSMVPPSAATSPISTNKEEEEVEKVVEDKEVNKAKGENEVVTTEDAEEFEEVTVASGDNMEEITVASTEDLDVEEYVEEMVEKGNDEDEYMEEPGHIPAIEEPAKEEGTMNNHHEEQEEVNNTSADGSSLPEEEKHDGEYSFVKDDFSLVPNDEPSYIKEDLSYLKEDVGVTAPRGADEYDLTEDDDTVVIGTPTKKPREDRHNKERELLVQHRLEDNFSDMPSIDQPSENHHHQNVVVQQSNDKDDQYYDDYGMKTRIDYRLTKGLERIEELGLHEGKNRSPDLIPLTTGYNNLRRGLRELVRLSKEYQESIIRMQTVRSEFVTTLAAFSENTPLYDFIGKPLDNDLLAHLEEQLRGDGLSTMPSSRTHNNTNNTLDHSIARTEVTDPANMSPSKESDVTNSPSKDDMMVGLSTPSKDVSAVTATTPEPAKILLSSSSQKNNMRSVKEVVTQWKNIKGVTNEDENMKNGHSLRTVSTTTTNTNGVSSEFGSSLMAMQQLSSAVNRETMKAWQENVVNYIEEWEDIVTSRVDTELHEVKELHKDRNHYDNKVDGLRKKINHVASKGRSTRTSVIEKLERNEWKLKQSWMMHEKSAGHACSLIEQATMEGWKDLYHLVKNAMLLETNRIGGDFEFFRNVSRTLEKMETRYVDVDPETFEATRKDLVNTETLFNVA